MTQKGKLKPPTVPLKKAFEHAMDMIDQAEDRVAIFMVGGEVTSTKSKSLSFENNIKRLASGLVGVYDHGADSRRVMADLKEFYPKSEFDGIDIDKAHKKETA